MSTDIIHKIQQIKETLPASVSLIAVTKTVSVDGMRVAYACGIRDFAENKLQEALKKQEELQDLADICWHFIGHLQTNKAKKAVESFSWIHSVDSLKLAQKLDFFAQQALENNIITVSPQVCLQVKILPDDNKYGWSVKQLYQDLVTLQQLRFLHLRGLMAILPFGLSDDNILSGFQKVRDLQVCLSDNNYFGKNFNQLSMGMSGDYLLAIKAGATMIRLGTIIFGSRNR
ncbi:YggS family pyridoxal phosphate-dependent enzyme [Geminocystis sp.]|uniref:YggS family pyridoxal phosphate-dependent enzyme n=1 Tax=Geminocystis sp. TaxID=2664100 RepID=UPI003593A6CB